MYVRTSTTDQESSLETQVDVMERKIKTLGWRNIVESFVDEGVPGDSYFEEGPAFKAMTSFIEYFNKQNPRDPIKEVWVQTRDSIARDVVCWVMLRSFLRNSEQVLVHLMKRMDP